MATATDQLTTAAEAAILKWLLRTCRTYASYQAWGSQQMQHDGGALKQIVKDRLPEEQLNFPDMEPRGLLLRTQGIVWREEFDKLSDGLREDWMARGGKIFADEEMPEKAPSP